MFTYLFPVVGAVVTDVGVVHAPGVEPLELPAANEKRVSVDQWEESIDSFDQWETRLLPVLVVANNISVILFLGPVHISSLRGESESSKGS